MQKYFVAFEATNELGTNSCGYTFAKKKAEAVKRAKTKLMGEKRKLISVWIAELCDQSSKLVQLSGHPEKKVPAILQTFLEQARKTYLSGRKQPKPEKQRRQPVVKLLPPPKKEKEPDCVIYEPYLRECADNYIRPTKEVVT